MARAARVAEAVTRGELRKYYRFRPARFYGGIATSDCVGCCLRCIFCWAWEELTRTEPGGRFCSPREVAANLAGIARRKGFRGVRISGNEPTIAREHLIKVLLGVPQDLAFILETNGILIGHDRTYAQELARFENLLVRVSLKGTTEEEFSLLTGAHASGFGLQIQALVNLMEAGVHTHPAVMVSFSPPEGIRDLRRRLSAIHSDFADFEVEELVLYGDVEERLRKANIAYRTAHKPNEIPQEQL